MRQQKGVGQIVEARVVVRLIREHIEAGGANLTGLQGIDQRLFVYQGPARRIDEDRTLRQEREFFARHQYALPSREVETEHLAVRQHRVETCEMARVLLQVRRQAIS